MGPNSLTQPNPTHQKLYPSTRPDPFWHEFTISKKSIVHFWTLEYDWTQLDLTHQKNKNMDPTRSNPTQLNPTHG